MRKTFILTITLYGFAVGGECRLGVVSVFVFVEHLGFVLGEWIVGICVLLFVGEEFLLCGKRWGGRSKGKRFIWN